MTHEQEFTRLYDDIHHCRKCAGVTPSIVPRRCCEEACRSALVLMAQAPSEGGVRKSGVHWIGADGRLRPPGGPFLDKYLRRIGYSIAPDATGYARPYTTNVVHCWPGHKGVRDRTPTREELLNCQRWWRRELELVGPRVIILLGQLAAEAFDAVSGTCSGRSFGELLACQGESVILGQLCLKRYVVPHPTAPYVGKSGIYQDVMNDAGAVLCRASELRG